VGPLVSIVTPVYNEEKYLGECIESVLSQTYRNWEYTILDNCSLDSSCKIARQYAAKDLRIHVVQNREFLPAIRNHNAALGLMSAESKYCKMIFADDWLFPECIERMVSVGDAHPSVGIVGAYGLQNTKVMWTGLPYPSFHVPGREVVRQHFRDPHFELGAPSSLLLRSDLVRKCKPFYNEGNLHADIEAIIVHLKEWDFGFVHQVLCAYRERPESISSAASEMTTYKGALLRHLVAHGPAFLSSEEFEECLEQSVDDYYNFLAVNWMFGREALFWEYHKSTLNEIGVGFSKARLARALALRSCRAALNPMETFAKIKTNRKERSIRSETPARYAEIDSVLHQRGRAR
jgi:glycosyltransferase involved in cell wall biosynthesis